MNMKNWTMKKKKSLTKIVMTKMRILMMTTSVFYSYKKMSCVLYKTSQAFWWAGFCWIANLQ